MRKCITLNLTYLSISQELSMTQMLLTEPYEAKRRRSDQLRGNCTADQGLCFHICKRHVFVIKRL